MKLKRRWRWRRFFSVGAIILFSLLVGGLALPREDLLLKALGIDSALKIRRGLDLQGGVYLAYEADLGGLDDEAQANAGEVVANAKAIIEKRVNPGGAAEAIVQVGSGNRIIVQLPGLEDPAEAIETIGRTAQLEFLEVTGGESGQQIAPTGISGQDVKRASVGFEQTTSKPIVQLEFKSGESTERFAELTTRLSGSASLLVAMLDGEVVFGPATVSQPITDGRPQLSGDFNTEEARQIATLLNAGALPVPVKLVAQQTIGPTLGELALKQSLLAALIGILSVAVFLQINYRWAGVVAVMGLIFYSLALITIIKLSVFTPYVMVLTLSGIAGFILSIAVAVDANILILERVKEELAHGASPLAAVKNGYTHAWTSIRDANAATIISSLILYWFGTPLIRGFALTLAVGVALSLATAATISRYLLKRLSLNRLIREANSFRWIGLKVSSDEVV